MVSGTHAEEMLRYNGFCESRCEAGTFELELAPAFFLHTLPFRQQSTRKQNHLSILWLCMPQEETSRWVLTKSPLEFPTAGFHNKASRSITSPTVPSLPPHLLVEVRKEFFEGARRARAPGARPKGEEAKVCYSSCLTTGQRRAGLFGGLWPLRPM